MKKLYIGNLPYRLDRSDLEELFMPCGEITEIYLVKDRGKRRLKGFGFVTFADDKSSDAALALDGTEFLGRTLKISVAKDQNAGIDEEDGDDDMMAEGSCTSKKACCWLGIVFVSVVVSAATTYLMCTQLFGLTLTS
jgi:cold-inducible RNA-binding protein